MTRLSYKLQRPAPRPQYVQQPVQYVQQPVQYAQAPHPVRQRGRQQSERASGESFYEGESEREGEQARALRACLLGLRATAEGTGTWFGGSSAQVKQAEQIMNFDGYMLLG